MNIIKRKIRRLRLEKITAKLVPLKTRYNEMSGLKNLDKDTGAPLSYWKDVADMAAEIATLEHKYNLIKGE